MKHTLSVTVENKPAVLTRVTSLFARRGFNIDSLAVGVTEDPMLSRITIIVDADENPLEQIIKQLHKLINVVKIQDLAADRSVRRELVLFKINATPENRHEIIEIANVFRAKVIDVGRTSLTIEATGTYEKLDAMEDLFRTYGIKELVRTGTVALSRGSSKD